MAGPPFTTFSVSSRMRREIRGFFLCLLCVQKLKKQMIFLLS
ncbi:hypothetical protein LEP1GSC058_0302 [Leptospira fainei serovar Hurstbridge str. BUT 6]|uniref:Uncharacterized protein n=1 Tax=Leptospira fainei serovar Hurstbridge str. BUT 6 TaxID=1193011 RepID=S3V568_9LEPT|nr:hypothetical protein LEP1GSC058_0302 [Leptospira fainei serovar Hurstbridge str. BUT 6]